MSKTWPSNLQMEGEALGIYGRGDGGYCDGGEASSLISLLHLRSKNGISRFFRKRTKQE